MVGQSRKSSLFESIVNVGIGYIVAILSQLAIFPIFGIDVPIESNLGIGAWFTGISLIRSYIVRRFFNLKTQNHTKHERTDRT